MSKLKECVFGSCDPSSNCAQAGYAVFRVLIGLGMALGHGLGKIQSPAGFLGFVDKLGVPAAPLMGWAAILAEFVGGLLIAIGLATRPAAALVGITMLVAVFTAHGSDPLFGGPPSKEMALLYLAACIAIVSFGSGKFGLDRVAGGKG